MCRTEQLSTDEMPMLVSGPAEVMWAPVDGVMVRLTVAGALCRVALCTR